MRALKLDGEWCMRLLVSVSTVDNHGMKVVDDWTTPRLSLAPRRGCQAVLRKATEEATCRLNRGCRPF